MTPSAEPQFIPRLIIGEVVGMVLIFLTLFTTLWWSRRRRDALRERPPEKTKLLRPAGYALQQRLQDLSEEYDTVALHLFSSGGIVGISMAGFFPTVEALLSGQITMAQLFQHPKSYVAVFAAALIVGSLLWAIRSLVRLLQLRKEVRACRLGLRGEQAVAETLNSPSLIAAGYVTFHDVPGDGSWNVDHVVVGLAGVFVVETKTRSRRKANIDQEEHVVTFDGQALQFPWCVDREVVRQAERNAEWVRTFIDGFTAKKMPVQAIVVVPGWYVKSLETYPVKAMNAKYLIKYLKGEPHRFSPEELKPILRRFDERCRDVEF